MTVNNAYLYRTAVGKKNFPEDGLPEIAFAGRSNAGKSSLINAMLNRKALARTSQSPGKTRTVNFYRVEDMYYFVDLPGYGYAKAKKTEVSRWGRMAESYLKNRYTLERIVLVVDSRRDPDANDKTMLEFLRYYNYRIILAATKTDKLKRSELKKRMALIQEGFSLAETEVLIPFSSETKAGRDELWECLTVKTD